MKDITRRDYEAIISAIILVAMLGLVIAVIRGEI